ncbi:MAG: DUF3089 domain-containing protein [Bacteroidetes bacterium]|nr:DUF3089 domain-containing protein [Bacteroidota bacterium]
MKELVSLGILGTLRRLWLSLIGLCIFPFMVYAQFDQHLPQGEWPGFFASQTPAPPDYSKLEHWAAHPFKRDHSDTVPTAKRKGIRIQIIPADTTQADVFFIYPTLYKKEGKPPYFWNADIEDDSLNQEIGESTLRFQASIFNAAGRVFAPRYRQAHLKAFFTTDLLSAKHAFDTAFHDVCMAFEYYLKHFNKARPFILAGHSQGSLHGAYLLKKYIDGKELQHRMVAAYLPGMALPLDSFKTLGPCRNPSELECINSWATYAPNTTPALNFEGCIMVNPLNWTTNQNHVKANANPGGTLWDFQLRPRLIDAQIQDNALRVHKPKHPLAWLIRMKNHHVADLNFFYLSVRNNAKFRVEQWWSKHR